MKKGQLKSHLPLDLTVLAAAPGCSCLKPCLPGYAGFLRGSSGPLYAAAAAAVAAAVVIFILGVSVHVSLE